MSDVQGRLFPAFNRLPESGFLVVLLRELGDPLDADCVFVVASHMIEDTARLLAEFLQSSNGAPISLSSLDQCVPPLPGSTWNFGIAEATSEWVIKLVEGGRLMQWPDAVETPVDGIRGLIANLHLQSGEAFAPEGPLPDCDYTGLRRRVFGLRARELSDRVHGLQPLRDHTVDLVTSGKVDAHQLEDLQSDLDAALSGELGELGHEHDGAWCVVIDTERALRVNSLFSTPLQGGIRTVVIAYGASLSTACWLHAVVKAKPDLFLRSDRLVRDPAGDEQIRSVRIVPEAELGWVGIDLTGRRNSDAYDALVEVVDGLLEHGVAMRVSSVVDSIKSVMKKAPTARLAVGA